MPHPAMRVPAPDESTDETAESQLTLFPQDANDEWSGAVVEFPLAYAEAGDEPADPDAGTANLEATMMTDLEAVASAFWMQLGPDVAPLDDPTDPAGEAWPLAGTRGVRREDRIEPNLDGLIGPEPRGALIDFRPPRRNAEENSRTAGEVRPVEEYAEPPGGAFADDLAARNKEFYELLAAADDSARKIAIPAAEPHLVRSGPGFESIFAAADPASAPEAPHKRKIGLLPTVAVGFAAFAIGAGIAVLTNRPAETGEASPALAAPASDTAVSASAKDESALPARAEAPAASEGVSVAPERFDPPATAAAPLDPGTLATPPLYESDGAPTTAPASSDAAAGLGAMPLRIRTVTVRTEPVLPTTGADATIAAKTVDVPADSAGDPLPVADEPAPEKPASLPAKDARSKSASKPEKTKARTEIAAVEPARDKSAGNSKLLRISSGPAAVSMSVNMRGGPDNDARVVKVLRAGTRVDVVSCKFWCEVIAGGDRGFVYQRYINRGSAAATPAAAPAAATPVDAPQGKAEPDQPFNLLWFVQPNG